MSGGKVPTETQFAPPREARRVRLTHRLSVRLAFVLGLLMFALMFLTSILVNFAEIAAIEQSDSSTRSPSTPFARYLTDNLTLNDQGLYVPTENAKGVLETFLGVAETYVWLDPDDRVMLTGKDAGKYVAVGDFWPLCSSSTYCNVDLGPSAPPAASSWTRLAIEGRHIGTFVLIYFELSEGGVESDVWGVPLNLMLRLLAASLIAGLTSVLLVNFVTRRLSRLAADASAPLRSQAELVDLPGPFDVSGEDEIALLATALNTMRGRIEELVASLADRDRQRRDWIAQVSHDLRTPLTALSACLERARDRLLVTERPISREAVLEMVNAARHDRQRMQMLVEDLFELARLDANDTLNLEPVPPGELIRQTTKGMGAMANESGIELRCEVGPALPTIRADGRRLMRALENLTRNGIHFAKSEVVLSVELDGDFIKLMVRDDGPGFPEKGGKAVLELTESHPRRPDSAGLGLVVVRRVAEAHDGELGGENRPEGGACVWLKIPVDHQVM
ncbi:MAG: HAMP domain-containing sensor histidine kinase [Phycisphaerae bacterium]|nr:HAMP domain-containing histidine kinase [Phycisphaerales bacterium]